tara:strand:- start:52059 stop:53336 length:1278 start_codon:yes stop_codon:yes gene_type:complete
MLGSYSVYAVNLASMMIMARLFTPEVFGTVAAIAVFFAFFQLMAEAGLGPAIINMDFLSAADRDGLFGLTLTVGVILAGIFWTMAPLFQAFYQLPRVEEIVPYVALSILFASASILPSALLLRDQAFFRIASAGLIAELVSLAATIALIYFTDPLHALAAKSLSSALAGFLSRWYFSGKTEFGIPVPGLKFSAIGPLLGFSGYQFGFNFINYFSRNLDNILIGKLMGAVSLGVYEKSYRLMQYPLMLLTFAMTPAIQPVIRRHAGDRVKVEAIHRDFTFKLSIVGAFAGLSMFLMADWVVLVILGNQWVEVVPIIRILAIAIPVQVILSTSGSFFQAMNRADLLFLSGTLSATVMVAAIIFGVLERDIELLCWCLVAAFHFNFFQTYYYLYRRVFAAPLLGFLIRMLPAASAVGVTVALSLLERM